MEWPKELKRTKPRKLVLSILENNNKPLSAMEIFNVIERRGEKVWLSTIYRILDLFEHYNLVIKNPISSDDVSVYVFNKDDHEHYAKCLTCHRMFTVNNCPLENFSPKIEDEDFQVIQHRVEIFGYCKNCK